MSHPATLGFPSARTLAALLVALPTITCAAPSDPPGIDRERLMQTLRDIPESRAAMGGPESVAGLDRTEAMIVERLRALGYDVRTEPVEWAIPARSWPAPDGSGGQGTPPARSFNNIIADLPGRQAAGEVLLVGAHYDAVPRTPGADDNATGTAALLELARVLRDRPMKRTVRLAFFTLEEVGLVGSQAHARRYPRQAKGEATPPGERLIGMLSLEMLGYFTDEPGSQRSPVKEIPGVFTPPTVGDFLAIVTVSANAPFCRRLAAGMQAGAPGLRVLPFDVLPVAVPDMLRSDHAPFLAMGVPAVMLTDTSNFRNPNYHRPSDTADTLDPERYALVVRGLAAGIEALAEPLPPGAETKTPDDGVTGR